MIQLRRNSRRRLVTERLSGVRSFMGWHQIPEFDSVSSSDDNPFASSQVQPTRKVSVKLPVDDWLCRKMEKLNLTRKTDRSTVCSWSLELAKLISAFSRVARRSLPAAHPPGPLAKTF